MKLLKRLAQSNKDRAKHTAEVKAKRERYFTQLEASLKADNAVGVSH